MPKVSQVTPPTLKPFRFHGLHVDWVEGKEQASADCPFCGREGKFSINISTGLWRCFVCNEGKEGNRIIKGGNIYTFLNKLWEMSLSSTSEDDYEEFRLNRRLMFTSTLHKWGVCKSLLNGDWLVPGWNVDGHLSNLYRYHLDSKTGKHLLLATSELPHAFFRSRKWENKNDIYICEGPWDGMALFETMRLCKEVDGEYKMTGSEESSLLGVANIVAVPGCNVFNEPWLRLVGNKRVFLLYDSDHSRNHPQTGIEIEGAGIAGVKRVVQFMGMKAEQAPIEVSYLKWGEDGYDNNKASGWDVRDELSLGRDNESSYEPQERIRNLCGLLSKITLVPGEWRGSLNNSEPGDIRLPCTSCTEWKVLVGSWQHAMTFHEGLKGALECALALVLSTPRIDDQLWLKLIGPPSSGKTHICEAICVNTKWCLPRSVISGFYSGYKTDKLGEQNYSLTEDARNKCLVTKDADSIVSGGVPFIKIMSQARDLFDGSASTHYGNGMGQNLSGYRMTWLLAGTEALYSLDESELGARFLTYIVVDELDKETQDAISRRVIFRQMRSVASTSNGDATKQRPKELAKAMSLTGGYINYLMDNGDRLLKQIGENTSEDVADKLMELGTFTSYMRARPSKKQQEAVKKEMPFRLCSQMTRLAMCLAAVLNKDRIDDEVIRRIAKVALDTSRGRSLEILKLLYKSGEMGETATYIAMHCNKELKVKREMLFFLKQIGVVKLHQPEMNYVKQEPRWRLTAKLRDLYTEILSLGAS